MKKARRNKIQTELARAVEAQSILLNIGMPPMGKARPRLSRGRVHMPKKYVQWKKLFGALAKLQTKDAIVGRFHINICVCTKSGKMRSDIDNVAGSILDALQDAKIIGNDRDCTNLSISLSQERAGFIVVLLTAAK